MIDIDAGTLRVLNSYETNRGAIFTRPSRRLRFGGDNGAIRVPDVITSRWARRLDWACAKIEAHARDVAAGTGRTPKVVQEPPGHSTTTGAPATPPQGLGKHFGT